MSVVLAASMLAASGAAQAASEYSLISASSISDLPSKVVSELELTSGVVTSEEITRGLFAKLLHNASSYKG